MAGSRPTLPGDSPSRRLGTGGGPGGNERLLRAQLFIATLLGLTILAVLLYLWRRPSGTEHAHNDPASPSSSARTLPVILRTKIEPPKKVVPKVTVGAAEHVGCGASARSSSARNLCDSLPFFEQALAKAVADTVGCAPKTSEGGTINYVLAIDFRTRDAHVYPGRSGSWHGKQAKAAAACVRRALTAPTWDTIRHEYRHYLLSVLATYPPPDTASGLPNFQ